MSTVSTSPKAHSSTSRESANGQRTPGSTSLSTYTMHQEPSRSTGPSPGSIPPIPASTSTVNTSEHTSGSNG